MFFPYQSHIPHEVYQNPDSSFLDVTTKVIHRFRPNKHHNNKYKRKRYKTWASYIKMMVLSFVSFSSSWIHLSCMHVNTNNESIHPKWWKRLKNYAWLHKNKLLYFGWIDGCNSDWNEKKRSLLLSANRSQNKFQSSNILQTNQTI